MSTMPLFFRSVILCGHAPTHDIGPCSRWEVLPHASCGLKLRAQVFFFCTLVASVLVRKVLAWSPRCSVRRWQKEAMFDGG